MTPDRLATLARAMGYTVTLDDSGGYGVVRVIANGYIFRPHEDYMQAFEVLAWLLPQKSCEITPGDIWTPNGSAEHNGTPEGIRNAIVEAAVRVAESKTHPRETALAQDAKRGNFRAP